MRVFHLNNLQMMSEESRNHSRTRKIECLEELGDVVWELNRASQTLTFTGLVRTTEGIGGLVVSSIIHHVTLEIIIPLDRMISTLGLDKARGPRSRFHRNTRISVRPHVVYDYEYNPKEDEGGMIVPDMM